MIVWVCVNFRNRHKLIKKIVFFFCYLVGGDLDGDGQIELVATTTSSTDTQVHAISADGQAFNPVGNQKSLPNSFFDLIGKMSTNKSCRVLV